MRIYVSLYGIRYISIVFHIILPLFKILQNYIFQKEKELLGHPRPNNSDSQECLPIGCDYR